MNEEAQKILDGILKKDPIELKEHEILFLRARRDYLKKVQIDEYASVLNQTSPAETEKQKHGSKR